MVGGFQEYKMNQRERELAWIMFEKYFQGKYLCEKYYDTRGKEFYEHKHW